MRSNHVRRDFYPMVSGSVGTDVTITPGSASVKVPWSINKIPTRLGRYFAYVPRIWVKLNFTVDQPAAGGSILYDEALAEIIQSVELRRTKFGTPWALNETSGPRFHHFDNRVLSGYRHPSIKTPSIAAADGDTTRELWIPLQFSHGCNEKAHHFAPPAALLNGSLLDIYANVASCLGSYSTGAVWKSATMALIVEVLWEPEARLHVPVKHGLYEPQAQGSTQRWELDMGARKGLDGVDDSAGAGLMALALPSSRAGLGGQMTVNEINRITAQFLGLDTLDYPAILSLEFLNSLQRQPGEFWPNLESAAATTAAPHTTDQLFFPLVMPGRRVELSKLSFVGGRQELIVGFTSSKAQATHKVYSQEVFPWDPGFVLAARELIFGDREEAKRYVPVQKFTRKQSDEDKEVMDDRKKRLLPWVYVPAAA